jgi:hypothetical protein
VALSQDMQCLLTLALGNEETRRLWDHPDSNQLDDRRNSLDQ